MSRQQTAQGGRNLTVFACPESTWQGMGYMLPFECDMYLQMARILVTLDSPLSQVKWNERKL